jgi:putative hydrolase of the HAD superfamily
MSDTNYVEIIRANSRPLVPKPTGQPAQLKSLDGIRAVLFDVYGTMVISGSGDIGTTAPIDKSDVLRSALCACGADAEISEQQLAKFLQAISDSHAASRERGIEFPEVDIVAIWRSVVDSVEPRQLAVEFEVRTNPVWPMPILCECLAGLVAAEFKLGIISNAQFYTPLLFPALLDRSLEALGFDPRLQFYSYQLGEAKPGLALYRRAVAALADLDILPTEVLYVGNDMRNDVMPASQIGFQTALFAGDARSLRLREDDPQASGVIPDLVVTDLPSLVECIISRR